MVARKSHSGRAFYRLLVCSDIYHPIRQGCVYKNGVLQPHCRICGKLKRDPERVVGIGLGEALEATDTAHFCLGYPEHPLHRLKE